MNALYVETSALLAWLFGEDDGPTIAATIDEAETLVASSLTAVETHRALIRCETAGDFDAVTARALAGRLVDTLEQIETLEVTETVRQRCARPFPVEPVRTLDAVHLATALELLEIHPGLRVLTRDRRVRDNAEALGFELA